MTILRRPAPDSLPEDIIATYRGWHRLVERERGWDIAKWVLINDLSKSAIEPRTFNSLPEVRLALDQLLEAAPAGKTAERLEQSLFFLNQQPGELVTQEAVSKRGMPWRLVKDSALDRLHSQIAILRQSLIDTGQLTRESSISRYERHPGKAGVVNEIRAIGEASLLRLYERFSDLAPVEFKSKEVVSSKPWSNMVTYEDNDIWFIANQGPLADNSPGRLSGLGVHEIAGHALHFSQLLRNETLRTEAPHLLCLSIHTYDNFFIEGIAEFMVSVFAERLMPAPTLLLLDLKRHELIAMVRHKNLTELIESKISVDQAVERHQAYLGGDEANLRKLYESLRNDMFFCCHFLVFYSAHQALLPALELPEAKFQRFLVKLLGSHHSPQQLDDLVAEAAA
jgi:hypothetical protein